MNYTGKDIYEIFTGITTTTVFWELKRSSSRNDSSNVHHIVFCGSLTNKSIGIAINRKINHIVTINRFEFDKSLSLSDEAIELMYKNDIFLIALGTEWLFNTKLGMKMVNKIITNSNASLWNSSISVAHVYFGLEAPIELNQIFARLRNSILYLPAKIEINSTFVTNLLLITKEFDKNELIDIPEVIIIFDLTSSIIKWCYSNGIILVFTNSDILYSEVARDFSYFVSKMTNLQTSFQTHLNYKLNLIKKMD